MKRCLWIGICLALAFSASPALAKKPAKKKPPTLGPVVSVSAVGNTAFSGGLSKATATCPAGTQAVGGGFAAPFTNANRAALYESFRSAPGAWSASAVVGTGSAAVTAYAYCRRTSATIIDAVVSAPVPATGGTIASVQATCPAGSRLISGGFQSTQGPTAADLVVPQDNYNASPGVWTLRAINNTSHAETLTTHAYCLAGIPAPKLLSASATDPTTAQFDAQPATTGACPVVKAKKKKKGKGAAIAKKKKKKAKPVLLSAGGFSTGPLGPGLAIALFTESRLDGTGWRSVAINGTSTPGSLTLTSQGICL